MKRILVIVVVYNGRRWLDRCLGSVLPGDAASCGEALQVDVFVWDNDSTDGSADFVATHYPQAKLVRSADNLGFSAPNNKAFEYAVRNGYDYVYLLNQDAWLLPGALARLVAAAEAWPEYGVLSPLQYQDGCTALDVQFAKLWKGGRGTVPETAGHPRPDKGEGPSEKAGGRSRSEAEAVSGADPLPEPVEVKRVMAAHWLVPVRVIEEIGPFNETLFPFYGQDDEWCRILHARGYKVGVLPSAKAVHDRAQRKEALEKTVERNYYIGSLVRLCDVRRPLFLIFLYVLLFTAVKVFRYRSFLPLKYFRRLCRDLPAVRARRQFLGD